MDKNIYIQADNRRYYKEITGSLIQYKIDYNGNILLRQARYFKKIIKKRIIDKLTKLFLKKKVKNFFVSFLKELFVNNIYTKWKNKNSVINHNNKKEKTRKIKKKLLIFSRIKVIIQKIRRIKEKFLEYKINNHTKVFNYMAKRAPRVLLEDANTKRIKMNSYYKYQAPGFPAVFRKLKRKFKKKLLIQRIRRKFKDLIYQEMLALHTFMGTKEATYADLIKKNKIYEALHIYNYRLRLKMKKKTNFRVKKFIQRPLKNLRMNQARFNVIHEPSYTIWYKKMQQQMLNPKIQTEEYLI